MIIGLSVPGPSRSAYYCRAMPVFESPYTDVNTDINPPHEEVPYSKAHNSDKEIFLRTECSNRDVAGVPGSAIPDVYVCLTDRTLKPRDHVSFCRRRYNTAITSCHKNLRRSFAFFLAYFKLKIRFPTVELFNKKSWLEYLQTVSNSKPEGTSCLTPRYSRNKGKYVQTS